MRTAACKKEMTVQAACAEHVGDQIGATPDPESNSLDGLASGTQVVVCPRCQGTGEIKYEYHFRAMTKQCNACQGNRVSTYVDGQQANRHEEGKSDEILPRRATRNTLEPRIMTPAQMCDADLEPNLIHFGIGHAH